MKRETLKLTLPLPPSQTKPNTMGHWKAKASYKSTQRQTAKLECISQMSKQKVKGGWTGFQCHATFGVKRWNDTDNLIAWLKSSIDGLQDSGLLLNDKYGIFWPPHQEITKNTGLVLYLTEWKGESVSCTIEQQDWYDESQG